ncbi:fimbrial protein [Lelliottia amnigena]|uniref:fimbrial protein n=1 Tax=Lelliottia amnigena TaxID=61646 RepID=UPI00293BEDFC|nr:fimbrial protein [Lelliottia amnigena]
MFKKILLIVFSMLFIVVKANAVIHGGYVGSYPYENFIAKFCSPTGTAFQIATTVTFTPDSSCTVSSTGHVPASGYYYMSQSVATSGAIGMTSVPYHLTTTAAYFDASKSIAEQEVTLTGSGSWSVSFPGHGQGGTDDTLDVCVYLVDTKGIMYYVAGVKCRDGYTPLPPTPPIPETSCTINDGNALSVSLGTLNRDEIPTVPDSGSAISKTISVTCTGGTVTANMALNYTPISIGSSQAVKSSTNGVGAAIFYSDKALSPSDVTPLNFLEGSNTLTLGFQAVRDSTVALKDIPTGAFTANAVLVMTQQ